jgi:hypothetical protein
MIASEATVLPPQLVGLAFSALGMVLGSFLPRAVAPAHHNPQHAHHDGHH